MYLIKIIASIVFLFTVTLSTALAQSEFVVNSNIEYKVDENGEADVTNTIKIKNNKSELFPKGYSLLFKKYQPVNLKVYENGNLLKPDFSERNGDYNYLINFEKLDVGIDTTKTFLVTYEIDDFAKKTGDTWEINIPFPENTEDFSDYTVSLFVPKAFGKENFLSQKPTLIKNNADYNLLIFNKSDNSGGNIYVSFGEFKTYDFDITYHLENPLDKNSYTEVAIIPDTNFQRVYYKNIDPKPVKIFRDIDGNFIAGFNFDPREKIDIKTTGFVQVFNEDTQIFGKPEAHYLEKNTVEDDYWEVNDEKVLEIARRLKSPREIYDYLLLNMSYDESKINDFKFERLGAKAALEKRTESLCLEFTDSFIAIARVMGIPAREINGFAFSDNPGLQPLSLVADVLHAWPEYWDNEKGRWVSVDPTWGKTSGLNYFDNFDMAHIVFAIHGTDSTSPHAAGTYKLGVEPKRDVLVKEATTPPEKNQENVDIHYKSVLGFNPFTEYVQVTTTNSGNAALYRVKITANYGKNKLSENVISDLLPFQSITTTLKVPYTFLGIGMAETLDYSVNGSITSIFIHKTPRIVSHLVLIFVVLSLSLTFVIRYIQRLLKLKHA